MGICIRSYVKWSEDHAARGFVCAVGFSALVSFAVLAGCSEVDPQAGVLPVRGAPTAAQDAGGHWSGGTVRRVVGDWDDVDAAVDIAVTQSQCGFLTWTSDMPTGFGAASGSGGSAGVGAGAGAKARRSRLGTMRGYTLLTIREEIVTLELRRELPPGGESIEGGPVPITITCRVGERGDANYERMIVGRIEQRLTELLGDKTARIADPWGINK